MLIINTKDWLKCKPEDRNVLIKKAVEVKVEQGNEMEAFVTVYNEQEELKEFKEAIMPEDSFQTWLCYEEQLKTVANTIKKTGSISRSCKLFPAYKNTLQTYINLLS